MYTTSTWTTSSSSSASGTPPVCARPARIPRCTPTHLSSPSLGQEEFDRLRSLSYAETHVIMLCFSVRGISPCTSCPCVRLSPAGRQPDVVGERGKQGTVPVALACASVLTRPQWVPEILEYCPGVKVSTDIYSVCQNCAEDARVSAGPSRYVYPDVRASRHSGILSAVQRSSATSEKTRRRRHGYSATACTLCSTRRASPSPVVYVPPATSVRHRSLSSRWSPNRSFARAECSAKHNRGVNEVFYESARVSLSTRPKGAGTYAGGRGGCIIA